MHRCIAREVTDASSATNFERSVGPTDFTRKSSEMLAVYSTGECECRHRPVRLKTGGTGETTQGKRHRGNDVPAGYDVGMSEVTRILAAIEAGDPVAADKLLPLVYDELRQLAGNRLRRERSEQSLGATALVHEAYLRLVGANYQNWDGKGHFFASAAEAMRRILINRARDRKRLKRGGDRVRLDLSSVTLAINTPDEVLVELDEALQLLAEVDPEAAKLVKLKFYAGLSLKEAAASMKLTRRQGDRLWAYARAWLYDLLRKD